MFFLPMDYHTARPRLLPKPGFALIPKGINYKQARDWKNWLPLFFRP